MSISGHWSFSFSSRLHDRFAGFDIVQKLMVLFHDAIDLLHPPGGSKHTQCLPNYVSNLLDLFYACSKDCTFCHAFGGPKEMDMKSMLSCGKRVNSNLSECHIWSLWSLLLAAISIETDWPLPEQVVGFSSDTQWYAAIPQLKLFLASRLSSTSSLSFVFQCDQCTEYVILLIRYSLYIIYYHIQKIDGISSVFRFWTFLPQSSFPRVLLALLCGILLSLVMIFAIDWIILRSPCQEQNAAMGSQGLKWGTRSMFDNVWYE